MNRCIAKLYWLLKGQNTWFMDEQNPSQITFLNKAEDRVIYIYLQQQTYGLGYFINHKWHYSGPFSGDCPVGTRHPSGY